MKGEDKQTDMSVRPMKPGHMSLKCGLPIHRYITILQLFVDLSNGNLSLSVHKSGPRFLSPSK